jgi:hypothetical protein
MTAQRSRRVVSAYQRTKHGELAWLFLIVLLALPLMAQSDPPLAGLRAELELFRTEFPGHSETRGASPRLTTIKHQLRKWIESQLVQLPSDPNGDDGVETALAGRLNAELKREHLLREGEGTGIDDGWSRVGLLGDIRLDYKQRQAFLVVRTAVEVNCGFDESAYLYHWQNGRWSRIWETEQNTYTKDEYKVQLIRAVLVSPNFNETSPYYVLTLGTEPWCSSNWHDVYVRLWSLSSSGREPKLLIDKSEWAFLGGHDIPVQGSVGRNDALIEYTVGSIDLGVFGREAVLHYSLTTDRAERIDPVALSPRDFVDEWLAEPWELSRLRSQPSALAALRQAHHDSGRDEFIQPTRHCRTPDLWQVGLGSTEGKKGPIYYLVRWRPPYHFTMLQVSQHPFPTCIEKDPDADDEYRTLFPVQDWRE